ncbi:MAG: Hpt domain-containing protein [Chlorobi bacterium]|nr:Hpt domain-containing protein [Chlorobiota bacterium]
MSYKVIDAKYLKEISTSFVFIKKMIVLFEKNVAEFEREMYNALDDEDYMKLGELAHKAKSSVMIFGMKKQSEEMKQLEFDAKNNKNKETFKQRVDDFIAACKDALTDIEELEKEFE